MHTRVILLKNSRGKSSSRYGDEIGSTGTNFTKCHYLDNPADSEWILQVKKGSFLVEP